MLLRKFCPLVQVTWSLCQVLILLPPPSALRFDVVLGFMMPHLYLSVLSNIFPLLIAEPHFFCASHFSFDCQLASLSAASFFDTPLLSQPLNTFNLLSSSLICRSILPILPSLSAPIFLCLLSSSCCQLV